MKSEETARATSNTDQRDELVLLVENLEERDAPVILGTRRFGVIMINRFDDMIP